MRNGLPEANNISNPPTPEIQSVDDYSVYRMIENTSVSPLRKYQTLAVGDDKFLTFLKYELLLGTVAFIPGAAGILLRQYLYKFLLRHLGKRAIIGRSVTLRHPGKISVGAQTVIDDYCLLNALGSDSSEITLENNVFVGRNTVVKTRGGKITMHRYATIGQNCYIGTTERIEIGEHVLIAAYCHIGVDNSHLDQLAALAVADPTAAGNPVELSEADCRRLYENSYSGSLGL